MGERTVIMQEHRNSRLLSVLFSASLRLCGLLLASLFSAAEAGSLPPFLEDRLAYYNSFEQPDVNPEINKLSAAQIGQLTTAPGGVRGRCALGSKPQELHLRSDAFSPHRPLSVLFWWALQADAKPEDGFSLFQLNGRGYVSLFSAGKGEWCALRRPAAVLQVWSFPGIQNVNGIYDDNLAAHVELNAGVWHHTALVFSGASLAEVYTDGRLAWKLRTTGRPFNEADKLSDLTIGSVHGLPLALDEVLILSRSLSADEIATYYTAIRQMQQVRYP